MTVLSRRDPLTEGKIRTVGFSLPKPLAAALKKAADDDGFRSVSAYVTQLLVFGLRERERERAIAAKMQPPQP